MMEESKMKKVIALFMVICMLTALCAASAFADAKNVTLKLSFAESQGDPKYDAMVAFKDYVEKESEGSITVELYPSNELGANADVMESISNGANIILSTAGDSLGDFGEPNFTAVGIFYTFKTPEEVAKFVESDLYARMNKNVEEKGNIKILSLNYVTTPRQIMSTIPLNSYEDLKNVKVRVPAPTYSTFFAAAGAAPVTMVFSDVYTSLESGIIEAVEAPLGTLLSYSLQEVAKYVTLSNHCLAPALLCMNNDIFNSLSEEQQQILIDGSVAAGQLYTDSCAEKTAGYRAEMEEAGVTFIDWTDEDYAKMADAAQEVYAAFPQMDADIYDQIMATING